MNTYYVGLMDIMPPATLHGVGVTLLSCISPFLRHLWNRWPWISLRGYLRSSVLVPIERYQHVIKHTIFNCNLDPILHPFRDTARLKYRKSTILNFAYPTPIPAKIWGVSFGVDPSYWGLQRVKWLGSSVVKLFSQNSNLYDHDTSKLQSYRQTDKPVGDWISAPSPNFAAMAIRVGLTTFCMVPLIRPSPKPPW